MLTDIFARRYENVPMWQTFDPIWTALPARHSARAWTCLQPCR